MEVNAGGVSSCQVTQEESATVSEGEGEGAAREAGRVQRAGRGDGGEQGAQGGRGEQRR